MFAGKKLLAVMLTGCAMAAAVWYASHHQNTAQSVAVANHLRSDPFADQLNRKMSHLASKMARHGRDVIFDNDASTDDILAMVLIANDPSVSLKAITVAGTGAAHGRQGAENMAAVAHLIGKPEVPVAYGHAKPLSSAGKPLPDFLRKAMDNVLVGTGVERHPAPHLSDNALALMKQVIDGSKNNVVILATGPLTNIAEFIAAYPQLKDKIERIVIMGGAIHVPGNIEPISPGANNKVSEWNFYADPAAAKRVFTSHIPITLVALDATNQVPMTKEFYQSIAHEDQPDLHLSYLLLKGVVDLIGMQRFTGDFYLWDSLAAMVMLDPDMAEVESMPLLIDATNGQVKVVSRDARHAANVDVVTKIKQPEAVLNNFVAQVKSNHIYAQRRFHFNTGRATAFLGRSGIVTGTVISRAAPQKIGVE